MGILPMVKIIHDPTKDAEAFVSFIWHGYFVQNREKILKIYPELTDILNESEPKRKVIKFVISLHQSKKEKLIRVIKHNQDIIKKKGNEAFIFLGRFMDYLWPRPIEYSAYLSLLPFSPFKKNSFFYSVLAELNEKNQENKSILSTAIHEISHIIFLGYLEKAGYNSGVNVSKDIVYILQECITAGIFKNSKLLSLLDMTQPPRGNPEIAELYVIEESNNIILVDFVDEFIANNKKRGVKMEEIVKKLLKIFILMGDQLTEKMNIWRKYGYLIFKDRKFLDEFKTPLSLDPCE